MLFVELDLITVVFLLFFRVLQRLAGMRDGAAHRTLQLDLVCFFSQLRSALAICADISRPENVTRMIHVEWDEEIGAFTVRSLS